MTVNLWDVDQLARVLTDAELRREMREKGLERAKLFSWEETAKQTLNVYKEVCRGTE